MDELGELLRDAREHSRLTIEDVSRRTRIQVKYLEALEQGEYQQLPGAAYVTGFLRNYAVTVGLHPDDVVQEYHAIRPAPGPAVRPATRVLASGHDRRHRSRIFWSLGGLFLLLGSGFAVKEYNATYAHPYSPPNITPPNLANPEVAAPVQRAAPARPVHLRLRAVSPDWVRVTVDGNAVFKGELTPAAGSRAWTGRHSVYVATMHGPRVYATVNGVPVGALSNQPGLVVDEATAHGWQRVA